MGSGGGAGVVPVIDGPFCASENCEPLRTLGAGLGTGTVCADKGTTSATTDAATKNRVSTEVRRDADGSVD